ncbi:MAG TPA: hypothetical protein PK521_12825 [Bacteroidales bacterium]|nr:hypothetical protein [Bacteroidales bacterium]HOX75708.1 hypothetical protein [Bacteroidales bacterium]HQM70184.1 hypothetical protein [Bacteroidales bacterium]
MDRRNFLKSSSAFAGAYLLSDPLRSIMSTPYDNTTWFNRPMR